MAVKRRRRTTPINNDVRRGGARQRRRRLVNRLRSWAKLDREPACGPARGPVCEPARVVDRLVDRLDLLLGRGEVQTCSWTDLWTSSCVKDGRGTRTAATTQLMSLASGVKHRGRWSEERGVKHHGRWREEQGRLW